MVSEQLKVFHVKHFAYNHIMEKEQENKPEIIIDIGAGRLPFGMTFSELENLRNKLYIAIDISKRELKSNRRIIERLTNANEFAHIVATAEQLPFKDNIANRVFLANFLGDPRIKDEIKIKVLQEIFRVLIPGGELSILEVYTPANREFWQEKIEDIGFQFKEEKEPERHHLLVEENAYLLVFVKPK